MPSRVGRADGAAQKAIQEHERPRPGAEVAADVFLGRALRLRFALPHDERRAEVAQAAEESHRLAERVDADFQRRHVAGDRRDAGRLGRAEHPRPFDDPRLRIGRDADVEIDAVELAVVGRPPLNGRHDRHELADFRVDRVHEFGVVGRFGPRDLADRHVGNRHEPARRAAERIAVAVLVGDELAAVGAVAKALRQEIGGDQFVDRVGRRTLRLRRHPRDFQHAHLADRPQPAIELRAIGGARHVLEERRRQIQKHGVVARERASRSACVGTR